MSVKIRFNFDLLKIVNHYDMSLYDSSHTCYNHGADEKPVLGASVKKHGFFINVPFENIFIRIPRRRSAAEKYIGKIF